MQNLHVALSGQYPEIETKHKCTTGAQKTSLVGFGFYYSVIFYTASASKYILQKQNMLFLTEVILV